MNDVKTTFYKTLNIIVGTNRVDNEEAYIINNYISRLEATIKDEQQEIERLNNIINELDNYFFSQLQLYGGGGIIQEYYDKLQELKGSDK